MRFPISIVTVVFVSLCLARISIKRLEHSDLNAFDGELLRNSERKLASLAPLEYLGLLKRLGKLALYTRLYRRLHENPYSGASRFTAKFPKPPVQFDKDLHQMCREDFVNCTYLIFSNVQERARFIFPAKYQYLKDFPIAQEGFRRMVSNRMFEFDMTVAYIMCYFTKNRVTALRYLPFCRYNANASAPYNIWHSPRFKAAKDRDDFDFWPRNPYFETIDDLVNGFDEFQCADQSFCPNPCCVNGQDELTTQCRHPACTDPLADATNATNYHCQAPVEWNRDLMGIVDNDWNITCNCGEKQQYRLDVRHCVDLNECLEDPCKNDSNTECVQTVGSFECVCRLGYLRNRDGTCSEASLHKTEWHGEAVKSASSALYGNATMATSNTALIVGGLTPLGAAFVRYLTASGAPSVIVYDKLRAGQKNEELPESATVVLGSVNNEQLLAKALNDNKVESVFYFPRGLCDPVSQEIDPVKSAREITVGVTHLLDAVRKAPSVKVIVHASSLEVYGPLKSDQSAGPLEKTTLHPQSAFAAALMGAESMLHAYAMSYRLNVKIARLPTTVFWAAAPPSNVLAQVAHSAVNGTKLNVTDDTMINLLLGKDAFTAIAKLSEHKGGVAEVFNIAGSYNFNVGALRSKLTEALNGGTLTGTGEPTRIDRSKIVALGWKDFTGVEFDDALSTEVKQHKPPAVNGVSSAPAKNRVRFLVYGGKGWIGAQFVKLLDAKAISYVVGAARPGSDPDDKIVEEILKVAPSHVVSMLGRTHGPGIGNIDYLEGGPDKLRENLQDNLYAPWILANICEKFGVHFTYLGTGCIFSYNEEHTQGGKGYKEEDRPAFVGNKYSVVKGFTDLSLRAFENTLNARIRLPVNDEDSPRNLLRKLVSFKTVLDVANSLTYLPDCLPILLDLALRQEVGNVNLVNPGAISFVEILKIYEDETGKKLEYASQTLEDNPNAAKLRAHCALDTSRVQQLCPQILPSREAMRQAARNLKI